MIQLQKPTSARVGLHLFVVVTGWVFSEADSEMAFTVPDA